MLASPSQDIKCSVQPSHGLFEHNLVFGVFLHCILDPKRQFQNMLINARFLSVFQTSFPSTWDDITASTSHHWANVKWFISAAFMWRNMDAFKHDVCHESGQIDGHKQRARHAPSFHKMWQEHIVKGSRSLLVNTPGNFIVCTMLGLLIIACASFFPGYQTQNLVTEEHLQRVRPAGYCCRLLDCSLQYMLARLPHAWPCVLRALVF